MYNLGDLSIPSYHNELELNLIATTREGADASKEFYAHISKKRNNDFREGKSSPFIRCISIYSKVGHDVQSRFLLCHFAHVFLLFCWTVAFLLLL